MECFILTNIFRQVMIIDAKAVDCIVAIVVAVAVIDVLLNLSEFYHSSLKIQR